MEIEDLRKIIQLLKQEGLTEITLCEGEKRITVRQDAAAIFGERGLTPKEEAMRKEEGTFAVSAPLVGTFYRRPSPEDKPFVTEGSRVNPGDTLCIIEAMKVMNEIKAERPGEVKQILVEEGTPVEFGQALFVLRQP